MEENKKEIWMEIIGFLSFVALLIFLYFAVCAPNNARGASGEWICWVNNIENTQCGTYGISIDKSVAQQVASDLCIKHCGTSCKLEYCEEAE